jgi:hypothetical protein
LNRLALLVLLTTCWTAAACVADESRPRVVATYSEKCADCGMEWTVTVLQAKSAPPSAHVSVKNTGERGVLTLAFNQVGAAFLDTNQAAAWAQVYAGARASRTVPQQFSAVGSSNTRWRPAQGTRVPVTLAPGAEWSGDFEIMEGTVPADAAALILTLGPVQYEKIAPGQPSAEFWITWDPTRPYIGLRGEVVVTPVP